MHALLLWTALVTIAQAPPRRLPAVAPMLAVSLTARALQPGEVVRVDAMSAAPLAGVRVSAFGRSIVSARDAAGTWHALVGIDLETPPGDYPLVVEAVTASGVAVAERRVLSVSAKEFPTRTLRVDPRFVTPPAAVRPRIEREAARLAVLFGTEEAEPAWTGEFAVPIEGALVSGFGVRSVFNGQARAPHGGADFASAAGTPVAAPGEGRVVLAADLYFTGGTLVIAHGGGLYSLLAHLSRRDVSEGDRVHRGQPVGTVGATGRATGPHLHWTVRLHTARVDPLSLIDAADVLRRR